MLKKEDIDINAVNEDGYTPFLWAIENGHTEVVKLLLEQQNINLNTKDIWVKNTPLHLAAQYNGHTDVIKLLLELPNIDINAKNDDGETPLHKAVEYGHIETIQLLLSDDRIIRIEDKDLIENIRDIGKSNDTIRDSLQKKYPDKQNRASVSRSGEAAVYLNASNELTERTRDTNTQGKGGVGGPK